MEYVVNASRMKQYDKNTTEHFGLPSLVLMERAALAAAGIFADCMPLQKGRENRVLILCGGGNNGGDGLAAGRLLWQKGYDVDCVLVREEGKLSQQCEAQLDILRRYGVCVYRYPAWPQREHEGYIDALFGIGLARPVEGQYAGALRRYAGEKGFKLALDMPSGIHTDTGEVMGCAAAADVTVTFGFYKPGLLLYPGCQYAGRIYCEEIGIDEASFLGDEPAAFTYPPDGSALREIMPRRAAAGNKGTFGKVLLAAGSREMSGACTLAALAALRTGAGMVKVLTAEENREILQKTVPEAMTATYGKEISPEEALAGALDWADVVGAGPGLGVSETAKRILDCLIACDKPLVLDADALNLVSMHPDLRERLARRRGELILTPHLGEFARLCGCAVKEAGPIRERFALAGDLAEKLQAQVVVKDARTLVFSPERRIYLNRTGNDGMATAGSGDVLCGMITALLAQGLSAFDAAVTGVYLHGFAGDLAAKKFGPYAMTASDLTDALKEAGKAYAGSEK